MVDVQTYEEYWKVTLAYTDIHSNKFRHNNKSYKKDFNDASILQIIRGILMKLL